MTDQRITRRDTAEDLAEREQILRTAVDRDREWREAGWRDAGADPADRAGWGLD